LALREKTVQEATKQAAQVPLEVMKKSLAALRLTKVVAEKGNENSITDAGVAGLMGLASVEGARYNVRINLTSLTDQAFVEHLKHESETVVAEARDLAAQIRKMVETKL
jgi:formiminotetrahydrofolate cyclodeaminase